MIEVRAASAADIEAVATLFLRTWRESYAGVLPERVISVFDESSARDLWQRALGSPRPGTTGFVAVSDGMVVGILRIGSDPDVSTAGQVVGHVFSLYVDPTVQGRGVGGRLLDVADEWFRAAGMTQATLWVFEANVSAGRFYERHGWHPDGGKRVEDWFDEPEVRLRRELG